MEYDTRRDMTKNWNIDNCVPLFPSGDAAAPASWYSASSLLCAPTGFGHGSSPHFLQCRRAKSLARPCLRRCVVTHDALTAIPKPTRDILRAMVLEHRARKRARIASATPVRASAMIDTTPSRESMWAEIYCEIDQVGMRPSRCVRMCRAAIPAFSSAGRERADCCQGDRPAGRDRAI